MPDEYRALATHLMIPKAQHLDALLGKKLIPFVVSRPPISALTAPLRGSIAMNAP